MCLTCKIIDGVDRREWRAGRRVLLSKSLDDALMAEVPRENVGGQQASDREEPPMASAPEPYY